jgi:Sec-independent protein secretion pathway component TatC
LALTPPDMISPFLLAIPLLGLYGLSIVVSYFFRTRPENLEGLSEYGDA